MVEQSPKIVASEKKATTIVLTTGGGATYGSVISVY